MSHLTLKRAWEREVCEAINDNTALMRKIRAKRKELFDSGTLRVDVHQGVVSLVYRDYTLCVLNQRSPAEKAEIFDLVTKVLMIQDETKETEE